MRSLTSEEQQELARRQAGFDSFFNERLPVLKDFMERLNLPKPAMVAMEAEKYLPPLDAFLKAQTIADEDRNWILTRLGYFIGELLVQKLNGIWFTNEVPDSRYFLHYVVGKFTQTPNQGAMIDPFYIADVCLSEATATGQGNLISIIDEVITELQRA